MIIKYLANCQEYISNIAKTLYEEWSHLMPGISLLEMEKSFLSRININRIPLALVAIDENDNWVGTISVIESDLNSRKELTPWIAGLYVKPEYRNRGIGSKLIEEIVFRIKKIGIETVFLYTEKAKEYYESRGWIEIELKIEKGNKIAIMKYTIN